MKSIYVALLLFATNAFAVGVDTSGGGRGVVCRTANGRIQSAELLDLWEARTIFRRNIAESKQPVAAQVASAFARLQNAFYFYSSSPSGKVLLEQLQPYADIFLKPSDKLVRLHGTKLNDTPDADEAAVPANCNVEQIVNFMDSPTTPIVLVNQDIVDRLSPTSQAALIVHEAFYAFMRFFSEPNSMRVRRAVGYVFAGQSFVSRDDVLNARHIECTAQGVQGSTVMIYQRPDKSLGLIQANDRGQMMIGLYDATTIEEEYFNQVFTGGLDSILSPQACANIPQDPTPNRFFQLLGQGPADFQRLSVLRANCESGSLKMQIGGGGREDQDMVCKMVEANTR